MKHYFLLFVFLLNCGSEIATPKLDASSDIKDVLPDVISDLEDSSSDLNAPTYKDPYRVSKDVCEDHFDCARGSYCEPNGLTACSDSATGCGVGGLIFGEEHGCAILNEFGLGQRTPTDCMEDNDCHPDFPYCYLRACQEIPPCLIDADCESGKICYWELFCVTPIKTCVDSSDCILGAECVNETCVYPKKPKD